jgi:2-oxoglutarate dehydrogenase complex dehydrogenase (E1) component-like enzyme
MSKLREVEILRQELGVEQNTKLDALKAELAHLAKECQEQSREHQEIQAVILESLITNLESLRREHVTMVEQVRVLESLYFTEITRRFDMIPDADQRTNEWVYNPTETNFTRWLQSTEQNDGLFYIVGKASVSPPNFNT